MSRNLRLPYRSTGIGLVEIMVGIVIGMLAIIVIMQVFSLSEGRRRSSISGSDAEGNGAIMLYQLQRDISQAGYGMSGTDLFNCATQWQPSNESTDIATPVPLAPVTINSSIIPAGDINTDTLLVMYGNSNGEPQGNPIYSQSGNIYTVQMPTGFLVGDRVIAAPASCASTLLLDKVTVAPVPPNDATTITVATGSSGATLYDLGQSPTIVAYAVRNGNLTMCDYSAYDCGNASYAQAGSAGTPSTFNPSVWVPIASNVVSLRAEYDKDTSSTMDGFADAFDQITPGSASDTSGIAPNCGWARISAIRLVLVARSNQYENQMDAVTTSSPVWAGTSDVPSVPIVLGTAADQTWQHYRYKTFQTVVPIRNIAWLGVPTGC